jgi:hypothetical protein
MSSFFAIINGNTELINKAKRVTKLENTQNILPALTVLAGPLSDRLFYAQNLAAKSGWMVSGIGIGPYPNMNVLNSNAWADILASSEDNKEELNGHFAGFHYTPNRIHFFTDSVGMRSLYIVQTDNATLVSTRIDWLIPFSDRTIDWQLFGPYWQSVNPFSGDCFVRGITRLRGTADFDVASSTLEITQKPWAPNQRSIHVEGLITELASSIFDAKQNLALGLSGGLDSRVLLALFVNQNPPISTYTFGGIDHPDERIVSKLIKQTSCTHQQMMYDPSVFSFEKLTEASVRSSLINSVSDVLTHALYQQLGEQSLASIDGGIGEIGRRRYLKSLELRGAGLLADGNIDQLLPYFYAPKADFFSDEISQLMNDGCTQDLSNELATMPKINTLGLANWLDLFSIRTRLSNIAGLTQEMVDDTHFHVMPFVQSDFLTGILSLPESERNSARLFRAIIKKHQPMLTNIPLVKGDEQYPYWMKDVMATLWNKLQAKLGKKYSNSLVTSVLLEYESDIKDLFSSKAIQESGVFNTEKVSHILSSFYELNDYTFTSSLNWMLTFELYRKSLSDAH